MKRLLVTGRRHAWVFPLVDTADPPELPLNRRERIWLAIDYTVLQLFHTLVIAGSICIAALGLAVVIAYLL